MSCHADSATFAVAVYARHLQGRYSHIPKNVHIVQRLPDLYDLYIYSNFRVSCRRVVCGSLCATADGVVHRDCGNKHKTQTRNIHFQLTGEL